MIMCMKLALTMLILSLILIVTSLFLEPFHLNANGVNPIFDLAEDNLELFFQVREQALTWKFTLQDYGITLFIFSLALMVFNWKGFKAPSSTVGFLFLAFIAPFLTSSALTFDMLQASSRFEYAPWENSFIRSQALGIPISFILGLVWACWYFTLLAGIPRQEKVRLSYSSIKNGHSGLALIAFFTAFLVVVFSMFGAYWYALAAGVWLYFYSSIAAVRHTTTTKSKVGS